ncbi:MAG TPA: hypothetical protein DD624_07800 [Alphaproteobacteria bacterium]|nr:hypothetical protein [Alphaproteobacteria bacterium]
MKKNLLLGLIVAFFAVQADAASLRRDPEEFPNRSCGGEKSDAYFKIAGFSHYPPFSWKTADLEEYKRRGVRAYKYEGFAVDLVETALKEIKVKKIESVFFDSEEELRRAVLEGKVDLIFTTFYQGGDKTGLDFIYPAYFGNPLTVISRADKKVEVADIAELKGMLGVIRREEGVLPLIQGKLPTDTKVIEVDGVDAAFDKLLSGEADFMISSPYSVIAESRLRKNKDKLHIQSKPLRPVKLFAAFSKMSKCKRYKEKFEEAFAQRYADKADAEQRMKTYIKLWAEKGDKAEEFPSLRSLQ